MSRMVCVVSHFPTPAVRTLVRSRCNALPLDHRSDTIDTACRGASGIGCGRATTSRRANTELLSTIW